MLASDAGPLIKIVGGLGRRKLLRLFHASKGRCFWCNRLCRVLRPGRYPGNAATRDHLFARGDRRRHMENGKLLVLSCLRCNQKRGDRIPEDFVFQAKEYRDSEATT